MHYMRTCLDAKSKPCEGSHCDYSMTVAADNEAQRDSEKTVEVPLDQIKCDPVQLALSSPPCKDKEKEEELMPNSLENSSELPFTFEKGRLQELGQARVEGLCATGPLPELDLHDPQVIRLQAEKQRRLAQEKDEVERWGMGTKTLAFAMMAVAILSGLYSVLSIFISAMSGTTSIVRSVVPLAINILTSLWMINISLKTSTVSKATFADSPAITTLLRFGVASLLAFLLQLVLMSSLQSIPELVLRIDDLYISQRVPDAENRKAEAYIALGYIIVWGICILNFAATGLALVLTVLLRQHFRLKEAYELEQKCLPLGYQLYPQLPNKTTSTLSAPYHI
jgi:hypothetical protein